MLIILPINFCYTNLKFRILRYAYRMYFAPYKDNWLSTPHVPMGSAFHCVPQVHALYFGPSECARHLFARFADDKHASYLVISDEQMSVGKSEGLVLEAIGEILQVYSETRAFILCTGCQIAFIALDGKNLCKEIKRRYNVDCTYLSVNRLAAKNTPGRGRVSVPGGDRFHTRSTLMQLISQENPQESSKENKSFAKKSSISSKILFLSDAPFCTDSEVQQLCIANSAQWKTYDDFLAARNAALIVSTAPVWDESAEVLHRQLNCPVLHLPISYMIDEIDEHYAQIDACIKNSTPEKLQENDSASSSVNTNTNSNTISDTNANGTGTDDLSGGSNANSCSTGLHLSNSINSIANTSTNESVISKVASAREDALCLLKKALECAGSAPIDLDLRGALRPWNLAWSLICAGFNIVSFTLDGHAFRYMEQNDRHYYELVKDKFPDFVQCCKDNAKKNDRPRGDSLLVSTGKWSDDELAAKAQLAKINEAEISHWGYDAISHLANSLIDAARQHT